MATLDVALLEEVEAPALPTSSPAFLPISNGCRHSIVALLAQQPTLDVAFAIDPHGRTALHRLCNLPPSTLKSPCPSQGSKTPSGNKKSAAVKKELPVGWVYEDEEEELDLKELNTLKDVNKKCGEPTDKAVNTVFAEERVQLLGILLGSPHPAVASQVAEGLAHLIKENNTAACIQNLSSLSITWRNIVDDCLRIERCADLVESLRKHTCRSHFGLSRSLAGGESSSVTGAKGGLLPGRGEVELTFSGEGCQPSHLVRDKKVLPSRRAKSPSLSPPPPQPRRRSPPPATLRSPQVPLSTTPSPPHQFSHENQLQQPMGTIRVVLDRCSTGGGGGGGSSEKTRPQESSSSKNSSRNGSMSDTSSTGSTGNSSSSSSSSSCILQFNKKDSGRLPVDLVYLQHNIETPGLELKLWEQPQWECPCKVSFLEHCHFVNM
jgi:hypothetical protein